jgi:hypothetical protein
LFEMVPGPAIELRETLPMASQYASEDGLVGSVKAAGLNHSLCDPPPAVGEIPGTRLGRNVPA